VLRCPALAGRITGVSRSVEPLVRHVLISRCLPPDQSGGAHTRTSAPSARNRTAGPTSGRHRVPRPSTTTHARRGPMSSSVLGPAADSAARPGSCRKPPGALYVKSGKEWDLLAFAFVVHWELTTFLRSGGAPRTAVHVVGPGECPIGLRMQPRNEKFFPFAGKARTPSSAPPFSRRSSRHASAGRSSPNGRPPSFTAAVAQWPAPKRTAPRHPARVAQIVARLSRRTDQILRPIDQADPTHDVHLLQLHWTVTLPPPVVLTAATARPLIDQAMPDQDPMHCDPRRNRPRATRPLRDRTPNPRSQDPLLRRDPDICR
jgi:hypothetical protein